MKKKIGRVIVSFLMVSLLLHYGFAQDQKLAQTGYQFLTVVSDARAAAMADAMTSLQTNSSSLFFNPAGMSWMENFIEASGSTNQWIADIKHYQMAMAISPAQGNYGVIGLSAQYVDYGNFIGTRVNPTVEKGYDDINIFKLNAYAVGVGYAKRLTDVFSVGGHIRWAHQDLGSSYIPNVNRSIPILDSTGAPTGKYSDSAIAVPNKSGTWVIDFGTQFKTGIKSLVFGMSIRNFSQNVEYVQEEFQMPLTFTLGISMDLMDLLEKAPPQQSLYMSIDASHYRDHPEQLKIGLEYKVMNALALRTGFVTNSDDENSGFSFGIGVYQFGFAFDYSYTPYGVFNNVQRMTARFSF
jgi:hypothetical protein